MFKRAWHVAAVFVRTVIRGEGLHSAWEALKHEIGAEHLPTVLGVLFALPAGIATMIGAIASNVSSWFTVGVLTLCGAAAGFSLVAARQLAAQARASTDKPGAAAVREAYPGARGPASLAGPGMPRDDGREPGGNAPPPRVAETPELSAARHTLAMFVVNHVLPACMA